MTDDPPAGRPRRWWRRALMVVGLLVIVWVSIATVQLWSAKRSTDAALSDLSDVRAVATADVNGFVDALASEGDTVAEETARRRLEDASEDFRAARQATRSPFVAPLRALPVVGRQIRSVDALASAAALASDEGGAAVEEAAALLEGSLDDPAARVVAAQELAAVLSELSDDIGVLDLGPSEALVSPLRRARDRFEREHRAAIETIDRTVLAADGVAQFLGGPSDYLLLAANNAEMQAGSAMYLQAGILHVEDGRLDVGDLEPTSELYLPEDVVPIDPDIEARWGALQPNQEWRNVNLSPRFDVTAAMAADMWVARGGAPVDGVLAVDIVALEALLGVTGPIEIDGQTVDRDTVVQDLVLDQYVDFQGDRDARRERLGDVARATFDALDERSWSPSGLLRSLQGAGEGRHLLAWSPNAEGQEAWDAIGIEGAIGPRSMLLSVLNRGGNKLDPYLQVTADLTIDPDVPPADGAASDGGSGAETVHRVQVEVSLTNAAPLDLPSYVAGPHPRSPVGEGTYRGYVSLTVPGAAGQQRIEGGEMTTLGDDGESRVVATPVVVERGATVVVTLTFDLPEGQEDLVIEPGARLVATEWRYLGDTWTDDLDAVLHW